MSSTPGADLSRSNGGRSSLPEGTEHVVVVGETSTFRGENPNEYRVSTTRLEQHDDVDVSEYIDDDAESEPERVVFEPGDELPLPIAAAGAYRAHSKIFACLDADGNRLDRETAGTDAGVRAWKASGN